MLPQGQPVRRDLMVLPRIIQREHSPQEPFYPKPKVSFYPFPSLSPQERYGISFK
jgi:hypothetical protein